MKAHFGPSRECPLAHGQLAATDAFDLKASAVGTLAAKLPFLVDMHRVHSGARAVEIPIVARIGWVASFLIPRREVVRAVDRDVDLARRWHWAAEGPLVEFFVRLVGRRVGLAHSTQTDRLLCHTELLQDRWRYTNPGAAIGIGIAFGKVDPLPFAVRGVCCAAQTPSTLARHRENMVEKFGRARPQKHLRWQLCTR